MLLLRFFHDKEILYVGDKIYKATCKVRNELNGLRKPDQVVTTYPITSSLGRLPYMPRKIPTGLWKVKRPIWTDEIDYSPVKIPTDAVRRVLLWNVENRQYDKINGMHQDDAFYHLHFARDSKTTLGCIRLNSAEDAKKIAIAIETILDNKIEVWLEVLASKE